ncbi:MAG: RNA methyltransferase [Ruminococcus sp.]|nr:RNA methyltransferase [Ruminococcus sp.]
MITLTSRDNPHIKNTVKLKKSAKFRRESGLFIAEGLRVCMDAALSSAAIDTLFVTEQAVQKNADAFEKLSAAAAKTFLVPPELFALISDTQTPQGFLCTIKTLDKSAYFDTINNGGKFLALDNVQDPNNLGAILRSAEAFGVSGVIMSDDCCDVFNPKVVRGSMGAVFRLPVLITDSLGAWFSAHPQINTYAAVVDDNAQRVTDISFKAPCAVVVGNEGNGIRPETLGACKSKITIPMNGKAESLNASVAAAILIWEMVR